MENKRRTRVEVIVIGPNNTILGVPKGSRPFLELPGGGVDDGENILDAAARELAEEAGWVAKDFCVINLPEKFIFDGSTANWFGSDEYTEEDNVAVVCTAVEFRPTELFGSEGDASKFNLLPLAQVIEETKETLLGPNDARCKLMARFRIAALEVIFSLNINETMPEEETVSLESRPSWLNW